jgi:hypothetical protein
MAMRFSALRTGRALPRRKILDMNYVKEQNAFHAAIQVLKTVVVKSSVFWDITPSKPVEGQLTFRRNALLPYSV